MSAGKSSFDLICRKHGKLNSSRANKPVLGIDKPAKRKNCCPACRKEYIQKHGITNANGIDWRYVSFGV